MGRTAAAARAADETAVLADSIAEDRQRFAQVSVLGERLLEEASHGSVRPLHGARSEEEPRDVVAAQQPMNEPMEPSLGRLLIDDRVGGRTP